MEHQTAKRLAEEIRSVGFEVTEGVGGTGIVGIMTNGPGPMIMVRAEMGGLPVKELSGLPNASTIMMKDWNGESLLHSMLRLRPLEQGMLDEGLVWWPMK